MGEGLTIVDLLGMLRRRILLIGAIGLLGILGSLLVARWLPPVYTTSARILVEHQQISDELVRSTVNLSASQRLQLIQERLMARDSLIATINRLGLFDSAPIPTADKIARLRSATRIESTPGTAQVWGAEAKLFAFTISVQWGDPFEAADIVNDFVDSVIRQNLEVRSRQARETVRYLEAEEQRIAAALDALEHEIANFNRANEVALPKSLEFRRSELQRLQTVILDNARLILELERELGELQAALEQGTPLRSDAPLSPGEVTLRQLEIELAQKLRVLAPNHPEIRRLQSQISAIQQVVAPGPAVGRGAPINLREQERRATEMLIDQTSAQLQALREQRNADLRARAEIEDSLRRTPEIEGAVSRYSRQLLELQEQNTVVSQRLEEARKGEQLEMNNQSERFEVLEAALVPDRPIGPSRLKYFVFGSGVSVGGALGLALALELLKGVIRSASDLERRVGIRPVIAIPYIRSPGQRRRRMIVTLSAFVVAGGTVLWALSVDSAESWRSVLKRVQVSLAPPVSGQDDNHVPSPTGRAPRF